MVKEPLTVTLIRPDGSVEPLDQHLRPAPDYAAAARRSSLDRRQRARAPADVRRGRLIDLSS